MKKLALYLSIIIALFALLFIIDQQSQKKSQQAHAEEAQQLYHTTPDKLNPATVKQLKDPEYQNIILPDQLKQQLDNKESLFVYFFSPTCSFCQISTPLINAIAADAGVTLYQFNKLEFDHEARTRYNVTETPTLIYFKEGQIEEVIVGGFSGTNSENDDKARAAFEQLFAKYSD